MARNLTMKELQENVAEAEKVWVTEEGSKFVEAFCKAFYEIQGPNRTIEKIVCVGLGKLSKILTKQNVTTENAWKTPPFLQLTLFFKFFSEININNSDVEFVEKEFTEDVDCQYLSKMKGYSAIIKEVEKEDLQQPEKLTLYQMPFLDLPVVNDIIEVNIGNYEKVIFYGPDMSFVADIGETAKSLTCLYTNKKVTEKQVDVKGDVLFKDAFEKHSFYLVRFDGKDLSSLKGASVVKL